jgi:hypothetical protein
MDWMIEVTTSFKCFGRTYFNAMTIIDQYLIASHQNQDVKTDKDILSIGITSLYLASKFDDTHPIHSKIIADKIAHGSMTKSDIIDAEEHFLDVLGMRVDFITHYDFHEAYMASIENQVSKALKDFPVDNIFANFCKDMMKPLSDMTVYMMKQVIQCNDFQSYSISI